MTRYYTIRPSKAFNPIQGISLHQLSQELLLRTTSAPTPSYRDLVSLQVQQIRTSSFPTTQAQSTSFMCEATKADPYYADNLLRWDMELPVQSLPSEFKDQISTTILDFYRTRFPNSLVCHTSEDVQDCIRRIDQEGEDFFASINTQFSTKDPEFHRIITSITTLDAHSTARQTTPDQILLDKQDERLRFHDVVPFRYNHLHCMGSWITPSIAAMQWPMSRNLAELYRSVQENNVTSIISLGPVVDTLYWDPDVASQHTHGQAVSFAAKEADESCLQNAESSGSLLSSSPVDSYHRTLGPSFGYSRSDPKIAQGRITLGTSQPVSVYRYDDWEDYDAPGMDSMEAVLSLAAILRWSGRDQRALVHCRAGVGRTGTLILLANCWREWETHRRVDVFFELLKLRLRREHMVQQYSQLLYVFYVLEHVVANDVRLEQYSRFACSLVPQ